MTSWSNGSFGPVVLLENLELGESLSENDGQSRRVCVVDSHPGWLFKEYRNDVNPAEEARLNRLIEQPARLLPADCKLIKSNTSWPAARVITDSRTIGVILPQAPSSFCAELTTIGGRTRTTMRRFDHLALGDEQMSRLSLPRLSLHDRVMVCSSIAAVSALFERHGLVYLDWSYANAFWSPSERAAYVIDVDSCSFGPRLQTETTGWADPLVPLTAMADNEVDRYRVALLVARCLTAERDFAAIPGAVQRLAGSSPWIQGVADHVIHALTATTTAARPSLVDLSAALTDAMTGIPHQRAVPQERIRPGSNVKGWTPVKRRPSQPPISAGPQPAGPPRMAPAPGPASPTVRRPTVPLPPIPASNGADSLTAKFGLLLLSVLLLAGLLVLIFAIPH